MCTVVFPAMLSPNFLRAKMKDRKMKEEELLKKLNLFKISRASIYSRVPNKRGVLNKRSLGYFLANSNKRAQNFVSYSKLSNKRACSLTKFGKKVTLLALI